MTFIKIWIGIWVLFFPTLLRAQERVPSYDELMQATQELRYNHPDSAYQLAVRALTLAKSISNPEQQAKAHNVLGGIDYIRGKYNASLAWYTLAHQYFLTKNNALEKAKSLNGLGLIHLSQHEYKKAVVRFQECLELAIQGNQIPMLLRGYFNLGISYSELDQYTQAKYNLTKTAQLSLEIKDTTHLSMAYNRLGRVYFELQKLDSALFYYSEVKRLEYRISNWEKTFLYAGLAEIALKKNAYELALDHAHESYRIAKRMNAYWDMQRASQIISQAFEARGDLRQALAYAQLNKIHSDSLYNQQKSTEINFLRLQLAEADQIQWEQDKKLLLQTSKFQWILAIGLGILTLLLGTLAWAYRKNLQLSDQFNTTLRLANIELSHQKDKIEKQNIDLNEVNQAKNKLFSILSHDLRGPIGNLRQFVDMDQEGYLDEEESTHLKKLFSEQLEKTERLLTNLLEWSRTQLEGMTAHMETLSIQFYIQEVIDILAYQANAKGLIIEVTECLYEITADKSHVRIILQNILNNAIKFTPEKGKISLFCETRGQYLEVHIKDSGAGFAETRRKELEQKLGLVQSGIGTASETGTGLGLMLVKQLLAQNQGKLEILSSPGQGTEVILSFLSHPS